MLKLVLVQGAPQELQVVLELQVQQTGEWCALEVQAVYKEHIGGLLVKHSLFNFINNEPIFK